MAPANGQAFVEGITRLAVLNCWHSRNPVSSSADIAKEAYERSLDHSLNGAIQAWASPPVACAAIEIVVRQSLGILSVAVEKGATFAGQREPVGAAAMRAVQGYGFQRRDGLTRCRLKLFRRHKSLVRARRTVLRLSYARPPVDGNRGPRKWLPLKPRSTGIRANRRPSAAETVGKRRSLCGFSAQRKCGFSVVVRSNSANRPGSQVPCRGSPQSESGILLRIQSGSPARRSGPLDVRSTPNTAHIYDPMIASPIGNATDQDKADAIGSSRKESAWQVADDVVSWYWSHGRLRRDAYAISPVWLRRVYQCRGLLNAIINGRDHKKASVALWGPSQSGKSTLISQFVDFSAGLDGAGGFLDWGKPVLFSGRDSIPDNVTVFNPHNIGADASGCVSRFKLANDSDVRYPEFPVEIQLLRPHHLMHALSAGYSSECLRSDIWTGERFDELLTNARNDTQPSNGTATIDQRSFEFLNQVIDVIGRLIDARDPRFTGLGVRGQWPVLANRLIESDTLIADERNAHAVAMTLLWDGQPALTRLYDRLLKLRGQLPNGRLFCTMDVAAVLVNIESYQVFLSDAPDDTLPHGARRIRETIRTLSWSTRGDDVLIGAGFPERKLLHHDRDFGLFQGLVRELVIPLRASAATDASNDSISTFVRVLNAAELVDFPGVPWRDKDAAESLLNLSELRESEDFRLLTEVLKRGKVRSLISDYSHSLGIDGFVLFAKAGSYVPKVEQIHRGLVTWWQCVDPTYDVYKATGTETPLPLLFNLTFFANIVNKFAEGAIRTGYDPLTKMITQLDPFVKPGISTLITTTYKHFREGQIAFPQSASAAIESILKDHSFGPRCRNAITQESLNEMTAKPDGGVGYLFKVVAETVSTSKRQRLLLERYRHVLTELQSLLQQQVPTEADVQSRQDVAAVRAAISLALETDQEESSGDKAAWVSYRVRSLLDVPADALDPIPAAGQTSKSYEEYVRRQLVKWIASKATSSLIAELGLSDPAVRTRFLGLLAARVDRRSFGRWLMDDIPGSRTAEDGAELRRILAIKLSNALGRTRKSLGLHPLMDGENGVIAAIQQWALSEDSEECRSDVRTSPHYTYVILPLFELLDEIADGVKVERPGQRGDAEAQALAAKLQLLMQTIA